MAVSHGSATDVSKVTSGRIHCTIFARSWLLTLNVQTGAIENDWFEPGFDSNLISFIRANPLPDANLSCFEMSFRYAE